MAKIIDKIVKSKNAPQSTNVLWDDGENLKIYRNGVWENTNKGNDGGIADLLEALKPVRLSDAPPIGNVTQEQLDEIGLTEKVINNIVNGYTNKICINDLTYSVTYIYKSKKSSNITFGCFKFDNEGLCSNLYQYDYSKTSDGIIIEFLEI